ncbi:MAG: GNAT family N-acetyltransferase [Sphaerochaeta sp.]|jgi:ribosomal protein S18 acetylase RimI-like enzyme|uniref:GNAT family N-acetyltransferase n=1 Tax=Sphaerochaeta TaxID=399320 RepID=UPI00258D092D|nr:MULTISPECIES: GNAT family N-acetyltransferase [Sphaerochaeta]MDD2394781.1 GNAT family N-acetyltransferase [Sphaerochaeta sp.]MDD3424538.1 GNAT family N-acetyltransferase [Sphaerochaeta sp.]MDD4039070.1 GNAT family N-acetyltransferase [Sphaerochaeta sp.]MEA5028716.1 GNAT family N-acetyltransferase [Sphaerochaeta associata]
MQYNLRPLKQEEYSLLEDFLYDAIFVPVGEEALPRSVLLEPSIQNYYQDFGRAHDYCLVAEQEGKLLGAVWARVLSGPVKGYGYVDEHTPELAISVQNEFRGKGIGTALLRAMLDLLQRAGYGQTSLSVQKENPAADLYKRLGFTTLEEKDEDYLMLYAFAR